ncbi:MAG: tRNA pseudouridine(55) synthase TruB [Pseudomonadota bacterium]
MTTKRIKRDIHGVVLLDKPLGLSSNRALQRVKYLFQARKAGHTGSLDPLATGMLPICFGDATRYSHVLLDAAKTYDVVAALGGTSSTGDGEGEITARSEVPALSHAQWQAHADAFIGASTQVPPMYSALKHKGKRLYQIARSGQQVERPPRNIVIESMQVRAVDGDRVTFSVRCSKGTYIRSLVEDLAASAGTLAWTAELRRTGVSPFQDAMLSMDALEQGNGAELCGYLMGCDSALTGWPQVVLDQQDALLFCQGNLPLLPTDLTEYVRCYGPEQLFLGSALVHAGGVFDGVRVMSSARAVLEGA